MQPKETRSQRSPSFKNSTEAKILANRYEVVKKLGCGSQGSVYLVSDLLHSKELYVVKEIYIGDLQPDETVGAVNEARLLCKLNHAGIVKFHNSFVDGDCFCIVTEFCEGGDLDFLLHSYKKAGKELDRNLLLSWFVQLLLAVQYMHQRNVLHRDLKSKNVFLKKNMIKVGDFGISRILLGNLDKANTFTGTPYYMAPEVLNQTGYNSKTDIWSLGVILYQMCCLEQPFQGKSLPEVMSNITKGDIPLLSQDFPEELQDIYCSMLRRDPNKRASSSDILKNQYITTQVQKLKLNTHSNLVNENEIKYHIDEIAEILRQPKKKKAVDKSNILNLVTHESPTARDQLRLRKQLKADMEAEKLKEITVSVYEESRQKYSTLKQRQSIVAVPFLTNEDKKRTNNSLDTKFRICMAADAKDYLLDINGDDDDTLVDNNDVVCDNFFEKTKYGYTHCFGENEEETGVNSRTLNNNCVEKRLKYTHCFGDDTENDESLQNLYMEQIPELSHCSPNEIETSTIPDDAIAADTFYSTFNDFEDDSGNSDSGELESVADYLQNALELTENADSTLVSDLLDDPNMMRQQKILSLRSECIKLLGEDGFSRVYKFLNKVRFESQTSISESSIMKRLRKLVSNPRDCFLVDQLLFLEKQNQMCM